MPEAGSDGCKKIGIQSTGIIPLEALLAKNRIDEKAITIIPIGADRAPLMTGQVDAVTGWQVVRTTGSLTVTQAQALRLPALIAALNADDANEGVRALQERRKPQWRGQ